MNCGHCGRPFTSNYPQTKWCSTYCRKLEANKRRKLAYRLNPDRRQRHIARNRAIHTQRMQTDPSYREYRKVQGAISNWRTSVELHQSKIDTLTKKIIQGTKELERLKQQLRRSKSK